MDTLIAELEAATEGSRELSDKVALAIGWKNEIHGDEARGYFVPRYATWTSPEGVQQPPNEWWPPPVTQSLDAALTLYKLRPDMIPSDPLKACLEALKEW